MSGEEIENLTISVPEKRMSAMAADRHNRQGIKGKVGSFCHKIIDAHLWLLVAVLVIFILVFLGILVGVIAVRLSHDSVVTALERQQQEDHKKLNDLLNKPNKMDHGMVVHYELQEPTFHHVEPDKDGDAEYVIQGYHKGRHLGNSTIHLKNHGYFNVQRDGSYSVQTKVAFVGFYSNAVIGIYIDDVLCDKGLTSASLSKDPNDQYKNVITCQAQCLHVEVKKGQTISIRSFHDKTIYEGDKTNWMDIERHPDY